VITDADALVARRAVVAECTDQRRRRHGLQQIDHAGGQGDDRDIRVILPGIHHDVEGRP
jgi:hypothetical protein